MYCEGVATFELDTSTDVTVKVIFEGNEIYESASTTVTVIGGEEKTVTLDLNKWDGSANVGNDLWGVVVFILGIGIMAALLVGFLITRKKS